MQVPISTIPRALGVVKKIQFITIGSGPNRCRHLSILGGTLKHQQGMTGDDNGGNPLTRLPPVAEKTIMQDLGDKFVSPLNRGSLCSCVVRCGKTLYLPGTQMGPLLLIGISALFWGG